jgi:hypothetical protein
MAMAYPTTLDELPVGVENQTDVVTGKPDPLYKGPDPEGEGDHASRHNGAAGAINRIQAELGLNPSGAQSDVAARLAAIDLVLASNTAGLSAAAGAISAEATRAEAAEAGKASLFHASRHQLGGADPLALPQYDPYDLLPYVIPMGIVPGTTLGPVAKRLYVNRFTVARKREFKFVRWGVSTVGTGVEDKVEAAIFRANGAKVERLATSGGVKTSFLTVGPRATELAAKVTCEPGVVYFVGWSLEVVSGTPQVLALLNNNGSVGDMAGTGTLSNRLMLFKNAQMPFAEAIEAFEGSTPTPYLLPSES